MTRRPATDTFLGAPFVEPAGLGRPGGAPRFAFLGLPLYVPYGDEPAAPETATGEIGRASCRERVFRVV